MPIKFVPIAKSLLKIMAFILALCLVVGGINSVLMPKNSLGVEPMQTFYMQPEDSVDVLFLGSSHVSEDVSTGILWDEWGIAAYDLGGPSQPLWITYYWLEEALKTQHPKLIVLDVFRALETNEYREDRVYLNTAGMAAGPNKFIAIGTSTSQKKNYLLGMPIYHNRYSEVTKEDIPGILVERNGKSWKGYLPNFHSFSLEDEYSMLNTAGDEAPMSAKSESFFIKIIELVQEEDIPLLLVNAPYPASAQEQTVFNSVDSIAASYGIPYISCADFLEKLDLSFSGENTDLADISHLNNKGSEKYSLYLGQYIKANYDIPDRRGEKGYESWQIDADNLRAKTEDYEIAQICELPIWLSKVTDESRFTLVINFAEPALENDNITPLLLSLRAKGLNLTDEEIGNGFVAIMQHGKMIKSSTSADFQWHASLFSDELMIKGSGQSAVIRLGYSSYSAVEDGVTVLLYDDLIGSLVEVSSWKGVSFDAKETMEGSHFKVG